MGDQSEPLDLSVKVLKAGTSLSEVIPTCVDNLNAHFIRLYERNEGLVHEWRKIHTTKAVVKKNVLPCSVCFKTFDRPSLLKRHMRTHTGEKPHICSVCKKGFSTSSSLNTHRRIHTGEKPHKCSECGKCFTASSNLYYHRMTHTKNKPHKCSLCPRSFPTPGDLRAHRPAHGGAWPHSCPLCARGFAKQTNLRHHLRLHASAGPTSRLFYTSHGKELSTILESLRLLKGSPVCQLPENDF